MGRWDWTRRALRFFWTPRRFRMLGDYNYETYRGVVHTADAKAEFAERQREYVRYRAGARHWKREGDAVSNLFSHHEVKDVTLA